MTRPVSTLGQLLAPWCNVGHASGVRITDLRLDHRELTAGGLFVALNGSRQHGLAFAQAAIAQGAVAIIYDPDGAGAAVLPEAVPCIAVPDLRLQLGAIAARFFGEPAKRLRVIGVTGTNGKTSTVQLLAQALTLLGHRCATLGTLGGGLWPQVEAGARTTPDAIGIQRFFASMVELRAEFVAMEVSSHALEQGRVQAVPFEIAVFTNLSRDHLDYHGTMEAYLAAKARLFHWPSLQSVVINAGDPAGQTLLQDIGGASYVIEYAVDTLPAANSEYPSCRLLAQQLRCAAHGLSFELHEQLVDPGMPMEPAQALGEVRSGLVGRFNVANLLAVLGVLHALDFELERCVDLVARLQPVPGRMNVVSSPQQPLVVVDYAHTPDALQQALLALRAHTQGQLGLVFGCGGERDAGKRPLMGEIAARLADWSIITDDNPRSEDGAEIVQQILTGMAGANVSVLRERVLAIRDGIARTAPGDALLIAGKGHENYQEVAGALLPFDDTAQARTALLERAA